jgi:hypothetical protein
VRTSVEIELRVEARPGPRLIGRLRGEHLVDRAAGPGRTLVDGRQEERHLAAAPRRRTAPAWRTKQAHASRLF